MKLKDKIAKEHYLSRLQTIKMGVNIPINESDATKNQRIIKAKNDFSFFVKTYLPHYISNPETGNLIESPDFHIKLANDVKKDKTYKGIVRWGRGLAKSVVCNIFIPLWLWINEDVFYMVIVGNNETKAQILLSDLQAEFEANQLLIHDFGVQENYGDWSSGYFVTKSGFIAKAIGMGQSPRGLRMKSKRPDYIVADDLEDKDTVRNPRVQDEIVDWLKTALIPTMDGNRRRFINANNNFAPRTIQEELRLKSPYFKLSQVNAYDPETYTPRWTDKYEPDYYRNIEMEIGVIEANAEYNNTPHIKGKYFNENEIQWAKAPKLNSFLHITGHWDIAYAGTSTADFNAVRIWGVIEENFWLLDCFVKQTKMTEAVEWMCDKQKNLPKTVSISWRFEAQFWNNEVKRTIKEAEIKNGCRLNLVLVHAPKIKKIDRIIRLKPYYQNGRIYYDVAKRNHKDTQVGLQQLYGIEPGYRTKDDAPDADEQAISYLETFIRKRNFKARTGKMNKNTKDKGYL